MTQQESPNGGKLYVAEERKEFFSTECFDPDIDWWKCTYCGTNVYVSKQEIGSAGQGED